MNDTHQDQARGYFLVVIMTALENQSGSKEAAVGALFESHKELQARAPEEIRELLDVLMASELLKLMNTGE